MSEIVYWDSKQGRLDSANFVQVCKDIELLATLALSNRDSADLFSQGGNTRKSLLCQLKAEMFAARAKELSEPKCSICGNSEAVRSTLICERCFFSSLLDPKIKAKYQSRWD